MDMGIFFGYGMGMKFHEKLRKRVEDLGLNKSKAAREAGLPESTISNYLVKEESLPRIDIAAKIAKAIRVPLEWLADDAADWPPPEMKAKETLAKVEDETLVLELAIRMRRAHIWLLQALEKAAKIDWEAVQRGAAEFTEDQDNFTPEMHKALEAVRQIEMANFLWQSLNPTVAGWVAHELMPGADRPREDFNPLSTIIRVLEVMGNSAYLELRRKVFADPPAKIIANLRETHARHAGLVEFTQTLNAQVNAGRMKVPVMVATVDKHMIEDAQALKQEAQAYEDEYPTTAPKPTPAPPPGKARKRGSKKP